MRIVTILILTWILLVPISADIPIEGMKQVNYQYLINNSADYPEYIFLTSSEIWGFDHPSVVVNGTFGGGYKLDGFVLHAMKAADLDPTIKEEMNGENQESSKIATYFEAAPPVTSDLMLPVSTTIDDTLPLSNLTVVLQIQDITDSELNITRMKTLYGYENGTCSVEAYQETDDTQLGVPGT